MQKTLALLLAVTMTLALGATAFAAAPAKYDVVYDDGVAKADTLLEDATDGTAYTLAGADYFDAPAMNQFFYKWSVVIGTGDAVEYAAEAAIPAADVTGKITATALWGYEVKYDLNGGTDSSIAANTVVKKGATITLAAAPATVPAGKQFVGWRIDDNINVIQASGTNVTVNGPLTIKAVYEDVATITYDLNGATSSSTLADEVVAKNCFLPKLPSTVTPPTGKRFAGWQIGDDTTKTYLPGELVSLTPDDGTGITNTLKALWEDGTTDANTITINGAADGHTFTAYQIFDGELVGSKLLNIQWGSGFDTDSVADLAADLKAEAWKFIPTDTTADKYVKFNALGADSTAAAFAEVFEFILKDNNDPEEIKKLAEILQKYKSTTGTASTEAAAPYTITGLADGYYLVLDSEVPDEYDFTSDYILKVVEDVTVNVKGSIPRLDKKVSKEGDVAAKYEDTSADDAMNIAVGDTLNYKIDATFPSNYADYDEYYVEFVDLMEAGLALNKESIKVIITNGTSTEEIDPDDYTVTVTTDATNGSTTLNVKIMDLKAVPVSVLADDADATDTYDDTYGVTCDSVITVKYTTLVTEDAIAADEDTVLGSTENVINEVYMNYSNDPHTHQHGKTLPDDTYVKPVSFKFAKIDGTTRVLLKGAKFSLFTAETGGTAITLYKEAANVYHVASADEIAADTNLFTEFEVEAWDVVVIDGLDADDIYYLEETVAPYGYNKLDARIAIQPSEDTDKATVPTTAIDATSHVFAGVANIAEVQNNSGHELPSTGGAGTVALIAIGAFLFMATAIVLITKKRLYNEG